MQSVVIFGLVLLAVQQCTAPPVLEKKTETTEHAEEEFHDELSAMEYHRYLREVVTVLETDQDFREKLEKASEDEIKSGNFAGKLEYVNHTVRTRLDELKRQELERLRHFATKEYEHENGLDHIDHVNPHTFEVLDLKKLITKTTKDLADIDAHRREQFREYEMQKKFDQEKDKKNMNEDEKKKHEEQLKALEKKHKDHKPIHHPGSKQQLEEVWEETDHMDNAFDPKTFFYLHDIDGNGVWDQDEVKSLFRTELDKLYMQGVPETDILERREEMERMREHVFSEVDLNKDNLISYAEFIEQSKKPEFKVDKGWESLDKTQIYTEEDYREFERRQREEMERRISMGISPPGHGNYDLGHQQQFQPQYGHIPVDHAGQPHPDFVPPMGARVPPNQQHYVDQQHQQQQQQHYVDQQQQFPGQVPHQKFQGQNSQFQGQNSQFQGHNSQFQGHNSQFQGQHPQYQNQQQIPQYQGHDQVPQYQGQGYPAQGHLTQQNYQQGQMQQAQHQQNQIPQHQQGQIPQQQQGQMSQHQQGQMPQQQGQIPKQQGQIPKQQGQIPQQQQGQAAAQQGQGLAAAQQHQGQGQAAAQQQQNNKEKLPSSNEIPQKGQQNSLPVTEKGPQGGNAAAAPPPNVVQT